MTAAPDQRRLARVQIHNWGTFDGYHQIPISRDGYLITGNSGSGKSTLLDAISAVLMSGDRVQFNAAAQESDRSGRTLVSYIRGAWRRDTDAESDVLVSSYLRTGATRSAVALTYRTADDQPPVTLLKLMHLGRAKNTNADVSHLHIVIDDELDLTDILPFMSDGIDRRAIRKRWPEADVNPSYAPFARKFRSRLGISTESAQRLLHRTLSAKSLASLDQLFRDYMLDPPETFGLADRAVEQFQDLREAHRVVVDARRQVEALAPLTDLARTREESLAVATATEEEATWLDAAHAQRTAEILRGELTELASQTPLIEEATAAARADDTQARDAVLDAKVAVEQLGSGRLTVLNNQREQQQEAVRRVTARRTQLERAVTAWGGSVPSDIEAFTRLQGQLEDQLTDSARGHEDRHRELYELSARRAQAQEKSRTLVADREALARRRSNLDPELLRAREILCAATSLTEDLLPFAGELLQVQSDQSEWIGPIERVLGPLGRTLLVPDEHYRAVAAAVDQNRMGARLVYRRLPRHTNRAPRRTGPASLVRKVDVAPGPMAEWLQQHLADRYDYACIDDSRDFGAHDRAVTRAGQVKHSVERHEKDDRRAIDDRRRWVLGFDNEDKLNDLRSRIDELDAEAATLTARLDQLDRADQQIAAQNRAAQTVLDAQWPEIDLASAQAELDTLDTRIAQWQQENPEHSALTHRYEEAAAVAEQSAAALVAAVSAERAHHAEITRRTDLLAKGAATDHEPVPDAIAFRLDERYRAVARRITSGNVDSALHTVSKAITAEQQRASRELSRANDGIVRVLAKYLSEWSARTGELRAEPDFADDALAVLNRLRAEGLPNYENRFFEMLKEQSTQNLGRLALTIRRAPGEIRDRIDPVNDSLRASPFDTDRWLRIQVRERRSQRAAEFLDALTATSTGSWAQESKADAEARFLRMSELLDRLGSSEPADRRWRLQVLDTRLHVGFIGEEFDDDGEIRNYHDSSAGLSGGQAQKLVFFCLAAALRYQLSPDGSGVPRYGTVILDEAFDRADATYTRRALDVFDQFGFHLVLATPLKLLQTLEDYIGGAATISIRDSKHSQIDLVEWSTDG
ncbi:ATP-binding protein [Gordonia phosphorivorans]|uniref:ATP-binding protein n=1 Tax=Gordonia phosphorivorans TaxID=1056982 RepID=A0ABV6H7N9_9ACTN